MKEKDYIHFVDVCAPGFGGNGSVCEKCPFGTYKPRKGNDVCTSCPEGTIIETVGEICVKCGMSLFPLKTGGSPSGNIPNQQFFILICDMA